MRGLVVATVVALVLPFGRAEAVEFKIDSLVIESPWARETPKGATIGCGYLEIRNNGTVSDRLIAGSVILAKGFQIHSMTMENGVAKMHGVTDGVEIKPGESLKFEPGSSHLMFVGLTKPLHNGDTVKGTLNFEHAGTVEIEYRVLSLGAKEPLN